MRLEAAQSDSPATDVELLGFAQSMELVLVRAYAIAEPLLATPAASGSAVAFADHHRAHAVAVAGASGRPPVTAPNPDLQTQALAGIEAAKTEAQALAALYELEEHAAATYQYLLEHLVSTAAIGRVAALSPVEGQHAVILGLLLHKELKVLAPPFQTHDGRYDTSRFPVH
jgi:hypothetical protein